MWMINGWTAKTESKMKLVGTNPILIYNMFSEFEPPCFIDVDLSEFLSAASVMVQCTNGRGCGIVSYYKQVADTVLLRVGHSACRMSIKETQIKQNTLKQWKRKQFTLCHLLLTIVSSISS